MKYQIFLSVHILSKEKSLSMLNRQILDISILLFNILVRAKKIKIEECHFYSESIEEDEMFKWALMCERRILYIAGHLKRIATLKFNITGKRHNAFQKIEPVFERVFANSKMPKEVPGNIPIFIPYSLRMVLKIKPSLNDEKFKEYLESLHIDEKIKIQNIYLNSLLEAGF